MSLRSRFFRVIIDPNVLIAAAISPNGNCARLLELAVGGDFTLVGSPHLLDELADVLHREKFRRWLSEQETVDFLQAVRNVCDVLPDPSSVGLAPVTADPKDDYLVLLYESAEATFIVSGDNDLLLLRRPGLDVRRPPEAIRAVQYTHPWNEQLTIGVEHEQVMLQAEGKVTRPFFALHRPSSLASIIPTETHTSRCSSPLSHWECGYTISLRTS